MVWCIWPASASGCLPAIFAISHIVSISEGRKIWIAAGAFLLMFGLALTSMKADTPTFDEQGFLVRGLAYLRGEDNGGSRRIRVGHPLGLNALNAALLVADPSVALPSDDPSWQESSFHRPAELFMWEIGNNVEHIMFLARVPTIWLGMLMAAVAGRWAARISAAWGRRAGKHITSSHVAGLITLLFLLFDPNILAHSRLVTTDLGLAAAAVLAGYTLWRALVRPTWGRILLAGSALGLLLNTKFTALLFLPFFGIVILLGLMRMWRARPSHNERDVWKGVAMLVFLYPVMAMLVLWAGHGFQTGPLRVALPIVGDPGGVSIPLSNYLDQLFDIGNRLQVSTPSFLLGRYADSGWWYYFPIAFLVKTPLPTLALLAWSILYIGRRMVRQGGSTAHIWFDLAALLIPAIGYFAIALTTDINLGYRHLLPILPFLYVFIGVSVGQVVSQTRGKSPNLAAKVLLLLLGWLAAVSLWIYPHYLAFFNMLAGGPDNGWRALVDSNIDWGQDLGRLAEWIRENDVDFVWLSYFGEGRPDYYGIPYSGLDSFPPRLMNPAARPFYPDDPAPGWYAISATTLQGVHFADHDQFEFFRSREPATKIGYSIFLYELPAQGDPADVLLGNTQIDDLPAEAFAHLGTNDVILHWFDPGQAIVLPSGSRPSWLVLDGSDVHPLLEPFLNFDAANPTVVGDGYRLYPVQPDVPNETNGEETFSFHEGSAAFTGKAELLRDGTTLTALTAWHQQGQPQPVKVFIHVLDEFGQIVAQWDGLGAAWEGWREGDTLMQVSELSLKDVAPGNYHVVAGLYDPESMERWRSTSGEDALELGMVLVP